MEEKIRKIAVVGTGLLGTQIAIQATCFDYEVSAHDPDEGSFNRVIQNPGCHEEVYGERTGSPNGEVGKGGPAGQSLQGPGRGPSAMPTSLSRLSRRIWS